MCLVQETFLSCTTSVAAPLREALGGLLEGSCRALKSSEQPAALRTLSLELSQVSRLNQAAQESGGVSHH